jgi:hypothetical protein
MINLEAVLFQEVKLNALKETLESQNSTSEDLMIICEDWWDVTKDSACLFDLYKIYRDPATRKSIRKALIFEAILVILTAHIA